MITPPLALIAELTHRCPLHCVYCSNPIELQKIQMELSTDEWKRVFNEAAQLGILHVHLTGGEPLARKDLQQLICAARQASLYTNLITSGLGLTEDRLSSLIEAGLDHLQLSLQGARENDANQIAGVASHNYKVELAKAIRKLPVAFTVNVVVHRQNLDHIEEIISLAESLQPDRLEVANVQYYGWALRNRESLLPTESQVKKSQQAVVAATERLKGSMRIDYVAPDYYARYPKPCMGGWGRRLMLIDPAGRVLPCHAANVIPGMEFDNVREHPLDWIWSESVAFNRFRGEDWMQEPCRNCERRAEDFGGCRCQAFLIAGDAAATDPVCSLSPRHDAIANELVQVNRERPELILPQQLQPNREAPSGWIYRRNPA
jgi:PqqA peptide cyclase